jgi:PadR family transcriptional regulator PadR
MIMHFPTSATVIEFLILAILDKEDSYGYDISQTIKLIANIKESTLYPILKRLVADKYLTTYSQAHQGRTRKYYTITPSGRDHLTYLKQEWAHYTDTVAGIIEGSLRHDKN